MLKSEALASAKGNLGICQDALSNIGKDLASLEKLRDRRQLETIVLHLFDAIRCQQDCTDAVFALDEARQGASRRRSSRGSTSSGGAE